MSSDIERDELFHKVMSMIMTHKHGTLNELVGKIIDTVQAAQGGEVEPVAWLNPEHGGVITDKAYRQAIPSAVAGYTQPLVYPPAPTQGVPAGAIVTRPDSHTRQDDRMDDAVEERDKAVRAVNNRAFILRAQADAVEAFGEYTAKHIADFLKDGVKIEARKYAQRLRNQADEAERGGEQ